MAEAGSSMLKMDKRETESRTLSTFTWRSILFNSQKLAAVFVFANLVIFSQFEKHENLSNNSIINYVFRSSLILLLPIAPYVMGTLQLGKFKNMQIFIDILEM